MTTEILRFPEMTSAQANKFVLYNENLRRLEAMTVSVKSRTNGGPPVTPIEGDAYIVDVSTGAWASFPVNRIAHYYLGTWKSYISTPGQRVTVLNENILAYFNGSIWINLVSASIGLNDWTTVTSNTTVVFGDRVFVDCTLNNVTITLPAAPTLGKTVELADITSNSAITNGATNFTLTINNNGANIEGTLQTITSNLPGKVFKLTYSNASYGWKLFK